MIEGVSLDAVNLHGVVGLDGSVLGRAEVDDNVTTRAGVDEDPAVRELTLGSRSGTLKLRADGEHTRALGARRAGGTGMVHL